jgi:hypothetical protein
VSRGKLIGIAATVVATLALLLAAVFILRTKDRDVVATDESAMAEEEEPLPAPDSPSAAEAPAENQSDSATAAPDDSAPLPGPGWTALFNGRDLTGWKTVGGDAWQVVDGAIDNAKGPPGAYLATERDFGDFELELEYRMAPGANSGVYFRAPENLGKNSIQYLEVQLLDTQRPSPLTNSADRVNGALYGVAAVSHEAPVTPNAWDRLALRAEGDRVSVEINGVQVVDADLSLLREAHPNMPGLWSRQGRILLQYHNGKTEFRNIRIRESQPSAAAIPIDGAAAPSPQKNEDDGIPRGEWFSVTEELTTLAQGNANVTVKDGVFELRDYSRLLLSIRARDVMIRAKVKPDSAANACMNLRVKDGNTYVAIRRQFGDASIGKGDPTFSFLSPKATGPFRGDGFQEFVFSAIGDTLAIDVNGQRVNEVADTTLRDAGQMGISAIYGTAWFKDVEIKILDPSPEAPETPVTFQGHAYRFFAESLAWRKAKDRCEELGGHLVVIDSAEENVFVAGLISKAGWKDAWIGITDEEEEGAWRTMAGEPPSYTNWLANQPNDKGGGEDYAIISNRTFGQPIGWRWCDQPNESVQHTPGFVCEWDDATDAKGF